MRRIGVGMMVAGMLLFCTSVFAGPSDAYRDPVTGMEFVFVKGGCFQMGDTFGDGDDDERPVHEVCVSDFYMGKYEVTQAQWEKVMGNNPSFPKGENKPVDSVTWDEAVRFAAKLGDKGEKEFRLPTEAEWEYAARSGGKAEKFAGTSDPDELDRYAWSSNNAGGSRHAVGERKPNGLGLYDMSGNVVEWCRDWYGKEYYKDSPRMNPKGPAAGEERVLRGGSWFEDPRYQRAAIRVGSLPSYQYPTIGFRLVFPSQDGK